MKLPTGSNSQSGISLHEVEESVRRQLSYCVNGSTSWPDTSSPSQARTYYDITYSVTTGNGFLRSRLASLEEEVMKTILTVWSNSLKGSTLR
jgi:hypothetical protein